MSLTVYLDPSVCHRHPERESMLRLIDYLRDVFDADESEDVRLLGWPLVDRHKLNTLKVDIEHDFVILTPKAIIVGDFKNYGGASLDGSKNSEWVLTTSAGKRVVVKGGSQANPYRQLAKNASDITVLLLDVIQQRSDVWKDVRTPDFVQLQDSIARLVLFSGPLEHKSEQLQKTLATTRQMHVLSMVNGLNDLKLLITASGSIFPAFAQPLAGRCVDSVVECMGFNLATPFYPHSASDSLHSFRGSGTLARLACNLALVKWTGELIETRHDALEGDETGLYRKAPRGLPITRKNELRIRLAVLRKSCLGELLALTEQQRDVVQKCLLDLSQLKPVPIVFDKDDIQASASTLAATAEFLHRQTTSYAGAGFPYSLITQSVFACHAEALIATVYEGGIWPEDDIRRYWQLLLSRLNDASRQHVLNLLSGLHFVVNTFWGARIKHWYEGTYKVYEHLYANGINPDWAKARDVFVAEMGETCRQDLVIRLCDDLEAAFRPILPFFNELARLKQWFGAISNDQTYLVATKQKDVYNWGHDEAFLNLPTKGSQYHREDGSFPLQWVPIVLLEFQQRNGGASGNWRRLPDTLPSVIESLTSCWDEIAKNPRKRRQSGEGKDSDSYRVIPDSSRKSDLAAPKRKQSSSRSPGNGGTPRGGAEVAVVGYEDMKKYIEEHLLPLRDAEKAGQWGLHRPGGILLYGPPGCGKTHWAQWIARSLGYPFIEIPRSAFGSVYVDGAMGRLASVIESAKKAAPAVVFFDEFDSVARDRQIRDTDTEGAKVVNTLLQEIPKLISAGVLLIAATNHVHQLDPAVIRPGRFDIKVPVFPPLPAERNELLVYYLTKDVAENSPLRAVLKFNKALSASYWARFDRKMQLFSNSHLIKVADDIKKRIMVLCEAHAGSLEVEVPDDVILGVVEGVRGLIRTGDVEVYGAFYNEVSLFFDRRSTERINALRDELMDFTGTACGQSVSKEPMGFHVER